MTIFQLLCCCCCLVLLCTKVCKGRFVQKHPYNRIRPKMLKNKLQLFLKHDRKEKNITSCCKVSVTIYSKKREQFHTFDRQTESAPGKKIHRLFSHLNVKINGLKINTSDGFHSWHKKRANVPSSFHSRA